MLEHQPHMSNRKGEFHFLNSTMLIIEGSIHGLHEHKYNIYNNYLH